MPDGRHGGLRVHLWSLDDVEEMGAAWDRVLGGRGPNAGATGTQAYDGSMAHEPAPRFVGLQRALRRLERAMGADREDRTLWLWVVPVVTVMATFAVLLFIGIHGAVDLFLTIPMALVLSVFLGTLSAIYLTAASSDERDADGPDDRRQGGAAAPSSPLADGAAVRDDVRGPSHPSDTPRGGEPARPGAGAPRQ